MASEQSLLCYVSCQGHVKDTKTDSVTTQAFPRRGLVQRDLPRYGRRRSTIELVHVAE